MYETGFERFISTFNYFAFSTLQFTRFTIPAHGFNTLTLWLGKLTNVREYGLLYFCLILRILYEYFAYFAEYFTYFAEYFTYFGLKKQGVGVIYLFKYSCSSCITNIYYNIHCCWISHNSEFSTRVDRERLPRIPEEKPTIPFTSNFCLTILYDKYNCSCGCYKKYIFSILLSRRANTLVYTCK